MKTRIVKVEKGERVWFETEYRFFFIWRPCFTAGKFSTIPVKYPTWETAADSIHRFRRLHQVTKRTVVRDY